MNICNNDSDSAMVILTSIWIASKRMFAHMTFRQQRWEKNYTLDHRSSVVIELLDRMINPFR